ncbi:hypothetical protein GQ457_06G018330 [Hibiscus cannabinus]
MAPVIIFVEDFDLFAGVRGKFIHTKKQDHEAFINQLLVELDGFEKQDGVVLMATTRNIKQIDEALQRPGRMDRVFHLQMPTQAERERILQIAAKETMDEELIDVVDWKKVAEKTALLRPIELKLVPVALEGSAFRSKFLDTDELMSYCSWFATFSSMIPKRVRETKLVKQISQVLVNHLGLNLTKDDLQNVVDLMEPYGRLNSCMLFGLLVVVSSHYFLQILLLWIIYGLSLVPGRELDVQRLPRQEMKGLCMAMQSQGLTLKRSLYSVLGRILLLPYGEENCLSASEIKQAQEIATRMVIQYGWGPDDSPAVYYSTNAVTALSMGNNHEFEMATKVEKIYDLAYEKARDMLKKNRRVLEKIVEELLEFEILTGKVKLLGLSCLN